MSTGMFIVYSSVDDRKKAEEMASGIVEARLAACVTILEEGLSTYRWQGRVVKEREQVLMIKTSGAVLERLISNLKQIHPYDLPEIVAVPVVDGLKEYIGWVEEEAQG